ncbi:hypothetical protein 2209_scaffold64_00097 [Bacteriophage sp.]|nr:hypothetical protein 2209_scaffold64_00097 [Bacteriophage sp.]
MAELRGRCAASGAGGDMPRGANPNRGVSGAGAADTGEGRAGHHLQPAEQLRLEAEAGGRTGQGHPREHEARRHLP